MTAILETRGLRKSYGGVRAVRGVDFSMQAGRVHALLGENGAGKSTFVGMLSGTVAPDDGEIRIGGEPVSIASPQDAQAHGLRTVHQELELAGPLSVAENVTLGRLPARAGFVRRRRQRAIATDTLARLGAHLDPDAIVDSLPVGDQQLVEIARALASDPRVLFLDEPTAALATAEIAKLLDVIDTLRRSGVAILYISHRLDEVLQIADDITVLRDGEVAFSGPNVDLDQPTIVTAMLGAELASSEPVVATSSGELVVDVTGLSAGTTLVSADVTAGRGEVVGFFGMAGSGHMQIADALYGIRRAGATRVRVAGRERLPRSPREALRWGIAIVPADRKREGLALELSIAENLLQTALPQISTLGIRRARAERSVTERLIQRYRIKAGSARDKVSSLSGGNQQKVVLGKTAATGRADILLLCEPTRGVDIGARSEIYRLLRSFAAEGSTCLIFSSDPDEIEAVCDRVHVVRRGRIARSLHAGEFTPSSLIAASL